MKDVRSKALTSNAYVNKLLLSNPNLDTKFDYFYDHSVVHYKANVKFIDILSAEIFAKRLTIEELNHIIFDYFDLPSNLDQISETSKIDLVSVHYFRQELKDDASYKVREAIALTGEFLNQYTYDPHPRVRMAVASKGYNLKVLVHDECGSVRNVARSKIR